MNWRCDCGKVMELSHEQLTLTGGVVVCPQCLGSSTIPGYTAPQRKPVQPPTNMAQSQSRPTNSQRSQSSRTISFVESSGRPTPPPHSGRQASTSRTRPPRHKASSKGRGVGSNGNALSPSSALGCVFYSIVATAVLLILYIFLGLLLHI